jgi:acyl carrier protein
MIPALFVFMNSFPLTPNGKVDRKSLPASEAERPDMENDFVEPRTQTEQTLAKLWGEVLNIDNIGIYDNFFDLGGHSLSAVQVTVKIHQAYNVELSLQTFFQASTLADLATKLEEKLLEHTEENKLNQLLLEIEQNSNDE